MPGTVLDPRDRYSNDWKRQKINTLEFTFKWGEETMNKIKYIMCYMMIIVVKKLKVDKDY